MRNKATGESLTDKQWDRIFDRCPGAWAGNPPKPDQPGSIVIDGTKIAAAVQFLNRNHVGVLSAKAPLPEIWCADGGIILIISLKQ